MERLKLEQTQRNVFLSEHREELFKEEQKIQEAENHIKKAISENKTPDILSEKSKDLFNELFGDK